MAEIKQLFKKSLAANPNHFAAHSHHPWPDCTEAAHLHAWAAAARRLDAKWEGFFNETLAVTRRFYADLLGGVDPKQICEGANTFELLVRLLSALPWGQGRPLQILTTDSEFYSFSRLLASLSTTAGVQLKTVAAEPFATFGERFTSALKEKSYDMVYLSEVLFNSGFVTSFVFPSIILHQPSAMKVIDGYHALGALPVNISLYKNDFFYLGGGYKYLAAGEGCCFLYSPPNDQSIPLITGWFTQFSNVANVKNQYGGKVEFPVDGQKWAGATFEPTPWYRLAAIARMWRDQGITAQAIHQHVRGLQTKFLEELGDGPINGKIERRIQKHGLALLGYVGFADWGNFLTFEGTTVEQAEAVESGLKKQGYTIDRRGNRVRFGFGIYHEESDVIRLANVFKSLY